MKNLEQFTSWRKSQVKTDNYLYFLQILRIQSHLKLNITKNTRLLNNRKEIVMTEAKNLKNIKETLEIIKIKTNLLNIICHTHKLKTKCFRLKTQYELK